MEGEPRQRRCDNLGRSELLEAMQACRILVSHNDASEPD